jgi:AcrR family transcriptional regulator
MKKRIVKEPVIRRTEILNAAGELFKTQGYVNTTVEAIIRQVGIAKGTFYYYFKSKEDIMDALVDEMVGQICADYKKIADDTELNAMEKMREMLRGQSNHAEQEDDLMEKLHRPENREFHERVNIEVILKISPLLAQVIEQGQEEAVFNVEYPLQTIQFLLAGSQFLLESGLFQWDEEERRKQALSMQAIIERSLGAAPGAFSFI